MVKYTGNGVAGREIAHELGCDVGMIIVKATSKSNDWHVYHRGNLGGSTAGTQRLLLNLTNATYANSTIWNNTDATSTEFTIGGSPDINDTGQEYIAYLFAHDPLGASGDGSDSLIQCGSYVGNGTTDWSKEINLGWEPQYILAKRASITGSWFVLDNIRELKGQGGGNSINYLFAESSAAEQTLATPLVNITPTGFTVAGSNINNTGETIIYMAIKRGMKTPLSSDEVFAIDTETPSTSTVGSYSSGEVVDMAINANTLGGGHPVRTRLLGSTQLLTGSTAAETSNSSVKFDFMDGHYNVNNIDSGEYSWMFKRAKGFFDVVAYTGDGIAGRTVNHNLGVVPEMIWVKSRSFATQNWDITTMFTDTTHYWNTFGNGPGATDIYGNLSIMEKPTADIFKINSWNSLNRNSETYIAYLFATLAGISKVGSYTGNGTSQTIDCGFSTGARFVLCKRTDAVGDWYIWDTVRGIVAGNDPHLSLNTTAAEVTTDDSIDTDTSGFIVNQNATTNINVTSAEYIYYAIALPI